MLILETPLLEQRVILCASFLCISLFPRVSFFVLFIEGRGMCVRV